jgi:RES domain
MATPEEGRILWRVGYYADPLGFTPLELYQFSHRFDDIYRRFRTMYCAESPETCLREVLADFRPNLGARQRHIERYGPEAAQDFTDKPVTAQWRLQHVLVPTVLELGGTLIDLTDVPTRQEIEDRHVELLLEHGLPHLDLHEITTSRRVITQTIAAYLFDRGAGAVRFPSRLDGGACIALFEGRGTTSSAGDAIVLTDPPPEPLTIVTTAWGLVLEPTP